MSDLLRPVRRFLGNVGLGRLLVTLFVLLAAIGIARYSWQLPVLVETERGLYDVRQFLVAPVVEQDPRIVIAVCTKETPVATGKRSPVDRKLLADALRSIDTMAARIIGINILID